MPYLPLYSLDVAIEKRLIAQKLIEITHRSLHLRPEERYRIPIHFIAALATRIRISVWHGPGVFDCDLGESTAHRRWAVSPDRIPLLGPCLRTSYFLVQNSASSEANVVCKKRFFESKAASFRSLVPMMGMGTSAFLCWLCD
jgi:hypothetical protein